MATERAAKPLSGFVKLNDIGDMVAGMVREFRKSEFGWFAVMEPVFVRKGRKGKVECYASGSLSITNADLSAKIAPEGDAKRFLSIVLRDTESTTKGSRKKLFQVLELNGQEMRQLESVADMAHSREPYKAEEPTPVQGELSTEDGKTSNEDDDLPF